MIDTLVLCISYVVSSPDPTTSGTTLLSHRCILCIHITEVSNGILYPVAANDDTCTSIVILNTVANSSTAELMRRVQGYSLLT